MRDVTFKVTYAIDSLDPNPTVMIFDSHNEMCDWIENEMSERIQWIVDHSPYAVSEEELEDIEVSERSLIRIEELFT